MKEALSKRLILGRLVDKIGKDVIAPFLNSPMEMTANKCLRKKYNFKRH